MSNTAQRGYLAIVGLGPGQRELMAPRAMQVIEHVDLVVGYRVYLDQIRDLLTEKEVYESELTHEVERATFSVQAACAGRKVCMVSSGDAGIYGMAGLVLDLLAQAEPDEEPTVEVVPGVSALNAAASLLGAPLMHDFAVISLSDLLTPWEVIAQRLTAVAQADFVVVLYNPRSQKRQWQLAEAQRRLLAYRAGSTPVGLVRNAYREGQRTQITTLDQLLEHEVDMFTTVIIGNSCTRVQHGRMITPRGYER